LNIIKIVKGFWNYKPKKIFNWGI